MPLHTQSFAGIPTDVEGRQTANDYIFFAYNEREIPSRAFDVAMEMNDGTFQIISGLTKSVKLPEIMITNGTLLVVIPKMNNGNGMKGFVGTIKRGKTYVLDTQGKLVSGGERILMQ